jgi:hypothetical protein
MQEKIEAGFQVFTSDGSEETRRRSPGFAKAVGEFL